MRTLLGVLGVIVALLSAMFVAMAIGDLAGGGDGQTPPSVLAGVLVLFSGACVAGAYLARRMFRGSPSAVTTPPASAAEQRILALAAQVGGRVTAVEVAARCGLSLADSRAALDRLTSQGVAELRVADDGTIVYAILGLLTPEAKAQADDVLAS
ncbi:MAG TPA: hypothetical protein VGC42_15290 [Kofleriaceae bacterium]